MACICRPPPPPSFVIPAVVSASALIIDVSPCIRQTMMDRPWEVCRAAGWGSKQAPTHCVGPKPLGEATAEQRGVVRRLEENFMFSLDDFWELETG